MLLSFKLDIINLNLGLGHDKFYIHYICSNLSGNKLNGSIPEALIQKSTDGSLVLRLVFHPI